MKNRKKIMVCGHYASGRSSLIQAVCKEGLVPDDAIHPQSIEEEARIGLYETEAVNFIDAQGIQLGELPPDYWQIIEETGQNYSPVDCIWYCIDGAKTSIQEGDQEILDICDEHVIVVITRSDLMTEEMIETFLTNLPNCFRPEQIVITSSKNKLGLNKLLEISKEIVFEDFGDKTPFTQDDYLQWDKYFAHQKDWVGNAAKSAERCIMHKSAKAFKIARDKKGNHSAVNIMTQIGMNEIIMLYQIATYYSNLIDFNAFVELLPESIFYRVVLGGLDVNSLEKDLLSKDYATAVMTYCTGCAIKAYCESNMTLKTKELSKVLASAKEKAEKIDWKNQPTGE